MDHGRGWIVTFGGGTDCRISRGCEDCVGRDAVAGESCFGKILRRQRQHAVGAALAVWQSFESCVGIGVAQAILPQVQFRAASGGYGGRDCPLAWTDAQFSARRSFSLLKFKDRAAVVVSGVA